MLSKRHLRDHGLEPGGSAVLNEINFDLPPLQGRNIRQHFRNIGAQTAEPYLSLAKEFAVASLPPPPEWFATDQPGWIRYDQDGSFEPVDDLGDEKLISFDVEVLYKLSPYPVMACAASPTHWYSWLSPAIFEDPPTVPPPPRPKWDKTVRQDQPRDLIPLFSGNHARIAIGHNVGYDRARVAEEYSLDHTPTRWLDTLSLHAASRGISSNQTPAWHSYRSKKRSEESMLDAIMDSGDPDLIARLSDGDEDVQAATRWEDITAINSLAEVAALHCGYSVDKSIRSRFGDETITHASQLRDELQELLQYNAEDVRVTHDVYQKVFPLFLESCPHPASFAGILPMGTSFLPVDKSWPQYLKNAEELYRQMEENVKSGLRVLADQVRREGPKDDPWLEQLDWSEKRARWVTEGDSIASTSQSDSMTPESTGPTEPKSRDFPPDTPAWLASIITDPDAYRTSNAASRTLPLLLRMTFRGHYVAYTSRGMWCFRVPKSMAGHFPDHEEVTLADSDKALFPCLDDSVFLRVARYGSSKVSKLLGQAFLKKEGDRLGSPNQALLKRVISGSVTADAIVELANEAQARGCDDPWGMQLDWTIPSEFDPPESADLSRSYCQASQSPESQEAGSDKAKERVWNLAKMVLGAHVASLGRARPHAKEECHAASPATAMAWLSAGPASGIPMAIPSSQSRSQAIVRGVRRCQRQRKGQRVDQVQRYRLLVLSLTPQRWRGQKRRIALCAIVPQAHRVWRAGTRCRPQ